MDNKVPSLCEACNGLSLQRSDFESPPFEPEGKYKKVVLAGLLSDLSVKSLTCSLCNLIYYALRKNEKGNAELLEHTPGETRYQVSWLQNNMEYDPFSEGAEDMYGSALYPTLDLSENLSDYCIQLVDDRDTDGFLRGRLVAENVDIRMIQGWLERCAQEHGKECKGIVGLEVPIHPLSQHENFLVIDVTRQCLVELPRGAPYVALSYAWGLSNWPRALQENVNDFMLDNAFVAIQLPKTISDAIDVTRALSFQYLWVDSLCIVQDSPEKQRLIDSMDGVYGNAALTIVAASSFDAHAGLHGWHNEQDRKQAMKIQSLGPDFRVGVLPSFDGELMNSRHAQRAWTFQEGCLSPRCLIFLHGLTYFSCRSAVWREDVHAELGDLVSPFQGANTLGRTLDEWPLRRFQQFVTAYTSRDLTFDSDALNAFSGIQQALANSMDGTRFWYGLPASNFDWALLWGSGRGERLERRSGFPSWSWAGWKGYVIPATDHWSEFDQRWLLERTWIDWYIIDGKNQCLIIWDPERDRTRISPLIVRLASDGRLHWGSSQDSNSEEERDNGDDDDEEQEDEEVGEVGQDSKSQEDEVIEPCPQYGRPVAENPFGRSLKASWYATLPARYPPPEREGPTLPLKSGTLCFETLAASYRLIPSKLPESSSNSNQAETASFFSLHDSNDDLCGIIWDYKTLLNTPPEAKILLLSFAAPGTSQPFKILNLNLPSRYQSPAVKEDEHQDGQTVLGEWHSWDLLNVMLVNPTMSWSSSSSANSSETSDQVMCYERIGLGLLHIEALKMALRPGPRWENVFLY